MTLAGPIPVLMRAFGGLMRLIGLIGMASPFGAQIAGVGALACAVWRNWDGITAWVAGKMADVRAAFADGIGPGLAAMIREFNPITLLAEASAGAAGLLGDAVSNALASIDAALAGNAAYDAVKGWAAGLWQSLSGALAPLAGRLRDTVAAIFGVANASGAMTALRDRLASAAERLASVDWSAHGAGLLARLSGLRKRAAGLALGAAALVHHRSDADQERLSGRRRAAPDRVLADAARLRGGHPVATVLSQPEDTLDLLVWRETGGSGDLAAALRLNPGLAAAELLPPRTAVVLPEPRSGRERAVIRLWGAA